MKKVKEEEKKITTMEELHEALIKLEFIETTFEELSTWEQYAVKCDKDPRWKLEFKVYQYGLFFCIVFIKDGQLHSFNGYGYPFPKGFETLVCRKVEWHDDRKGDIEY